MIAARASPRAHAAERSKGSIGCDYYAVNPDIFSGDGAAGGCFAAYIANTWDTPVTVHVEYGGKTLDASSFGRIPTGSGASITYQPLPGGKIPPGQVAILFLNRHGTNPPGLVTDCPRGVAPASPTPTRPRTAPRWDRRSTSAPMRRSSAYDILPYGGGKSALTSATLLLPTSAWGTNYVGVDGYREGAAPLSMPFLEVVAQQDGTTVTINPTANVLAGTGVAAATKGMATTYNLARGQVLQLEPATIGGLAAVDAIARGEPHRVELPGRSLGRQDEPRDDRVLRRLRAPADPAGPRARQRVRRPCAIATATTASRRRRRGASSARSTAPCSRGTRSLPTGAPTTLARGQVVEFMSNGPFVVKSQDVKHPFYMSAHMTGAGSFDPAQNGTGGAADGRGDPEFVNVIPPGEFHAVVRVLHGSDVPGDEPRRRAREGGRAASRT